MNEVKGMAELRTDLPDGFQIFHLMQPNWDPAEPMKEIFSSVMAFEKLTHVGTGLWFKGSSDSGPSRPRFHTCGGTLQIVSLSENLKALTVLKNRLYNDESVLALSCSKCDMQFGIQVQVTKLQNIIFHLMLKQMMPALPFCNFLNCDDIHALGQSGVISLSDRNLCHGSFPEFWHSYQDPWSEASLAFRILPGMDTQLGFCDLDRWASMLITKKFAQMKAAISDHSADLLGPKPMKTLIG